MSECVMLPAATACVFTQHTCLLCEKRSVINNWNSQDLIQSHLKWHLVRRFTLETVKTASTPTHSRTFRIQLCVNNWLHMLQCERFRYFIFDVSRCNVGSGGEQTRHQPFFEIENLCRGELARKNENKKRITREIFAQEYNDRRWQRWLATAMSMKTNYRMRKPVFVSFMFKTNCDAYAVPYNALTRHTGFPYFCHVALHS